MNRKDPVFGHFGSTFPNFQSVTHSFLFLATCQNSNTRTDRRIDGRTDRLFYRAIPTTAGGPKSCCDYYCSWNIRTITTTFEKYTESLGIEMFRNQHC